MNLYEWLPTECADERFPMQIVNGDFFFGNNGSIYIPDGRVIHNGWGEIGSIHIVGEQEKPIPDKLAVQWFSYVEDEFYSGEFALPVEKLVRLFEDGLESPSTKEQITYDKIIVGLALEGGVSLWLGGGGVVVEVDHFQAKKADIDWTKILDNKDISKNDYIKMVLDETLTKEQTNTLKENGVPKGLWKKYRSKPNWDFEILNSEPTQMWLKTYNGEKEFIDFTTAREKKPKRAIPKKININWQSADNKEYTAHIIFDETETFAAFQKLSEANFGSSSVLRLEIDGNSHSLDVWLRNSNLIAKLSQCAVKVYSLKSP